MPRTSSTAVEQYRMRSAAQECLIGLVTSDLTRASRGWDRFQDLARDQRQRGLPTPSVIEAARGVR